MTIVTDQGMAIDLKQLLILIDDDLDLKADLCLDLDCRVVTDDPVRFAEIVRCLIVSLRARTRGSLSIGLSALREAFDMVVVGRTDATPVEALPVSEQEFASFGGVLSFDFVPGNYMKAVVRFDRS